MKKPCPLWLTIFLRAFVLALLATYPQGEAGFVVTDTFELLRNRRC